MTGREIVLLGVIAWGGVGVLIFVGLGFVIWWWRWP